MTTIRKIAFLSAILLTLSSCKSKLITLKVSETKLSHGEKIYIVKNHESKIIPVGIYPSYKNIDKFVKHTKPSLFAIDSLISSELAKHRWNNETINSIDELPTNANYITYSDYWAWDFKQYMHVLFISVNSPEGEPKYTIVSQGNMAGMHNYPNPQKQVPLLIKQLVEN